MSFAIAGTTNEIFCSYAHEDLHYIEAFRPHLRQLEREGMISCWYDGMIGAGQHWRHEIEIHLNSANIILLFVSADFLNSDFCMETELPIALARSNRKEALVIPVIVRMCDWQNAQFAHLQTLPKSLIPIAQWGYSDEAYTQIAKSIRDFIYDQRIPPMRCSLLNLPFHRNSLFTGREEILQKLHAALKSGKETSLMQAIKGLGGIGKTQVAVEYAYRYQNSYARIIWLSAESHEMITSDVVKLAREINTPGCYNQDQNSIVQGFLAWLEMQHGWLLILDNVEDIALARSYVPKSSQGHLLLTTRKQAIGGAIEGISLDVMDEKTGGTFLLKRAKLIPVELTPEQIPTNEMRSAMHLSNVLGGLPLPLDQAGGYIERKQCSLERYLQIYEQEHERLLAEHGFPEDITDYKHTVTTTWSLSFQQVALEKHGQAAMDLLRLCAFLAPDEILVLLFEVAASVETFPLGLDLSPVAADPVQLEEALEALLKYSLLRREGDALFIHRLVQVVLRDKMTEEERSIWIERAVTCMSAIFPNPEKVEYWPACQYLLQHMLTCVAWIENAHITFQPSLTLLNQTIYYLKTQGLYEKAIQLCKVSLAIRRKVLGEQHPDTAASLNNLALLYDNQGRYEEAEPLHQEALAITRKALGEQHPDTATCLSTLALLYHNQERFEEAEPLCQEALAITRKALGEQHLHTATSLHNLAALYDNQGRYEEAEPLMRQALAIMRNVLGEQHPDTAASLNNLALLYDNQGRYEEAEPLMRQALAIKRKVLGEQHPDRANSLNNLAEFYRNQGRFEEAEPLYLEAVAIIRNVLGEQHPHLATSLNNLALLYEDQGRDEETEPLYQEVLAIMGKQHISHNLVTANSSCNLAALYFRQGRFEEAEPLMKQALAIMQKVLGEHHLHTATSLNNLAALYEVWRRFEEAESLMWQALAIMRMVLGEQHLDIANYLDYLARFYNDQGRFEEAEPLMWQALAIMRKALGEQHPQTVMGLNNLALLYRVGYEPADIVTSLNNLALLYKAQGKYAQAELLYMRALAIVENVLGQNHPSTQTVRKNHAILLQMMKHERERRGRKRFFGLFGR